MNRFPSPAASAPRAAFSLVEVCLALGIISFALVAIIGLLGVGINASRSTIDETTVSFAAQDVCNRVRAEVSTANAPPMPVPPATARQLTLSWTLPATGVCYAAFVGNSAASPPVATACYDRNGSFLAQLNGAFVMQNGVIPQPLYRAAVSIGPLPASAVPPGTGTPPPYNQPTGGLTPPPPLPAFLVVTVQVGWPTDAGGTPPPNLAAKSTYTFYLPRP